MHRRQQIPKKKVAYPTKYSMQNQPAADRLTRSLAPELELFQVIPVKGNLQADLSIHNVTWKGVFYTK